MTSHQNCKTKSLPQWLKYIYRIVILLIWGTIFALCLHYKDEITIDNILNNTPANHLTAFFVIVGLFAVKSASIFIYCGILYVASGLLFPFPLAMLTNICGSIVMFTLPYFIGKRVGSDAVDYITQKYPKVELIKKLRYNQDFKFAYIVRIISLIPLDLVSLYMGAVRVNYPCYLCGSILAFIPTMTLLSIMGKNAVDPASPQFILAACLEALYMIISGAICIITIRKHRTKTHNIEGYLPPTKEDQP